MICAIVWGDDDTFGRFNNSLSMNGTGITQHDVVLPDVEAGVTYQYVVEGTTADGTWYRSDVGTFSVEAVAVATTVDRGPNLATGARIVDVSSEFSDDFAAANAIDGDTATEWATDGDGDRGSITIDLGSSEHIGGVAFLTRSMADGTAITDTFTLSVDGADPHRPVPGRHRGVTARRRRRRDRRAAPLRRRQLEWRQRRSRRDRGLRLSRRQRSAYLQPRIGRSGHPRSRYRERAVTRSPFETQSDQIARGR